MTNTYSYQRSIFSMLQKKPMDRKIHVFIDFLGNSGKSTFGKRLSMKHNALGLNWEDSHHLLYARYMKQDSTIVYFDLPRARPVSIDLTKMYSAIESIKNGSFLSTKFKVVQVITAQPHVLIFANALPPIHLLSNDRWSIYIIDRKKQAIPITPELLVFLQADRSRQYDFWYEDMAHKTLEDGSKSKEKTFEPRTIRSDSPAAFRYYPSNDMWWKLGNHYQNGVVSNGIDLKPYREYDANIDRLVTDLSVPLQSVNKMVLSHASDY